MEPSCCDPHARAGLTHLAHPHRARVRPAEPLDAPGACPALTPRAVASIGVQRRPAGSRAGTGQDQATGATARCSDSCQTSSPGRRDNSTFSRVSQPCPPLAAKPAAVL